MSVYMICSGFFHKRASACYVNYNRSFVSGMNSFAIGALIAIKTGMLMKDALETTIKSTCD
jgi:hypothetical protein